jgi:HrpA-like RNA helicase
LIKLGALDGRTAELTQEGKDMAVLPTDPLYSKLLVTSLKSSYRGIRSSITAIVAMLSVENVFYQPAGDNADHAAKKASQQAMKRRALLLNQSSDHLALLNVFNIFHTTPSTDKRKLFCREHMINFKSLMKAL